MAPRDPAERPVSPHPTADQAGFIPRLGQGQQSLVPLLRERGVSTVAVPLYFLEHNQELSLVPTTHEMGKVLDPCTHKRQLPWAARSKAFRSLAFGNEPEPYEPDRSRLSDMGLVSLASGPIDAQRGGGATLMLTTFHTAKGIRTRGRDLELVLAELGVRHFRQQRIDEPPARAEVPIRREIYATIAIRLEDLRTSRDRATLADAYLSLNSDGFWVKIADFGPRAALADIRAASAFIGALREGGLPVVSCGAGQLHLAFLAGGVSASIGLAESELFTLSSTWSPRDRDGARRGRRKMAYHATLHHSFRVGSAQATAAFAAAPCSCDLHRPESPPSGTDVAPHAAVLRAKQAREALDGQLQDRREWLIGAAALASWKAADAKLPDKHTSVARYQAVFDGLVAGRELLPGEQAQL